MKKHKLFSYLLLSLLLSVMLAACGSTATNPPAPATTAPAIATTAASAPTTAPAVATTAASAATTVPAIATTAASAPTTAPAVATTAVSTTAPSGRLVMGVTAIPTSLNPVGGQFNFTPQVLVYGAFLETLTWMDGTKLSPAMAISWKQLDTLNWEFKLRPGIKFHNGEDFDAAAVKFAFDTYRSAKTPEQRLSTVDNYEVVSADTVRIKTKVPDVVFATKLAQVPLFPPKYYAEKGADGFAAAPVGSGPFQFVSFEASKQVTFKAFSGSWRGTPKVAEIVFRQIPDFGTQIAALKAGEIDVIKLSTKDQYDDLKSKGFKVYDTLLGSTVTLDLENLKGGALADKRVRQALNLAINKPEMIEGLFGKLTQPAQQVFSPVAFGFDPNQKAAYGYDVEKAKALLKEAGVKEGDLTLAITYQAGAVGRKETVEALTQYYSQIGVKVEGQPIEPAQFIPKFNAGELGPATIIAKTHSPSLDGYFAVEYFTNSVGKQRRFNSEQADTLFEQMRNEIDMSKRELLLKQMNRFLDEEAAYVPLYYGFDLFASSAKIEGMKAEPNGFMRFELVSKKS